MRKIFVSSHGRLATGIQSSLNILIGNTDKVTFFDAYLDETNVKDALDDFFKNVNEDDQVFLLSDLYGGSVNSQMFLELEKPNTNLIAGVNLALVLELVASGDDVLDKEQITALVENARNAMTVVELEEKSSESDDFF